MRVLLVEDSELLRRSLSAALKKAGYAVDAAVDGPDGSLLAETNDYDAIVLDIMLPRLDGLSVLRRLSRVVAACSRDAVDREGHG